MRLAHLPPRPRHFRPPGATPLAFSGSFPKRPRANAPPRGVGRKPPEPPPQPPSPPPPSAAADPAISLQGPGA